MEKLILPYKNYEEYHAKSDQHENYKDKLCLF